MRKNQKSKIKSQKYEKVDYTDYTPRLQKRARKTGEYAKVLESLKKCNFCDLREKYIVCEEGRVALCVSLFPYIDYHLLIIPRRHVKALSELKPSEWKAVKNLTERAFFLYKEVCQIKDVQFIYREGERAGKTVDHFHIHLIPFDEKLLRWNYQKINVAPLEAAGRLRRKLADYGKTKD